MTALILTMTTAGLGRFTAAQGDAGVDLTVTQVGLTAASFVAAPSLTALPGEFRRIFTVSGKTVADNIVHMTVQDDAAVTYAVRGFGLYLADGTLFATYSQPAVLMEKSIGSMLALAIDIAFPQANADNIRFGSTDFLNPPATTEVKGVVELATLEEADAGDGTRVTTGSIVKTMIARAIDAVSEAIDGLRARTIYGAGLVRGGGSLGSNITLTVDAATSAQVLAGTAGNVAVTPAGLAALAGTIATNGEFQIAPGVFAKIGLQAGPFGEGPVAINFPTAFPNACLFATGIAINTAGDIRCDSYVQERFLTAATFTAYVQKQASDSTNIDAIRWIAIGR